MKKQVRGEETPYEFTHFIKRNKTREWKEVSNEKSLLCITDLRMPSKGGAVRNNTEVH